MGCAGQGLISWVNPRLCGLHCARDQVDGVFSRVVLPAVRAGCSPELIWGVEGLGAPQRLQIKLNTTKVVWSYYMGFYIRQRMVLHHKLSSEFRMRLELDDKPTVLADVDPYNLEPG